MADDPKTDIEEVVGPGGLKVAERQKPMLDGLDENYYVEILNPLSATFVGRVASSRPVHRPITIRAAQDTPTITRSEDDVRRNYGLDLRNPDHESLQHFSQEVRIPAGKTIRLPGNEAQVVIRQLVNVIMDKEGNKLLKGDSFARGEVEQRVVIKQGTMSEFFQTQDVNVRNVINRDLQANEPSEQSFPSEAGQVESVGRADSEQAESGGQPATGNRRGRPPKITTEAGS